MATLDDLSLIERKHWELHLNAAIKDTPSVRTQARIFLRNGELPNIKHPSDIHDWLEQPDRRLEIEAHNG